MNPRSELFEKVETLQNMYVSYATGTRFEDSEFRRFREELLEDLHIPDQVGHRFRSKLATDSGLMLATCSGGKLATFRITPEWVASFPEYF